MSFNSRRRTIPERAVPTYQGGKGFTTDPKMELYRFVAGSLYVGNTFYETKDVRLARFRELSAEVCHLDPHWMANLAIYAHDELHLRSAPSIMVAELFLAGRGDEARRAAWRVWQRGDEHLETMAYAKEYSDKRLLQKSLRRAVGQRLNSMGEYAFMKYAMGARAFSQADAIKLVRPVPKDSTQSAMFQFAVHGWDSLSEEQRAKLPNIARRYQEREGATWEQHISEHGSTAETWEAASEKMGYMALLRNLRNLIEKGVSDEVLRKLATSLADPEQVRKSKQLPFRFLSAFDALPPNTPNYLTQAISDAMDVSVENVTRLEGLTAVLVDVSGFDGGRMVPSSPAAGTCNTHGRYCSEGHGRKGVRVL